MNCSCVKPSNHNYPNQTKRFTVLSKVISATAATTREQAEHNACNSSLEILLPWHLPSPRLPRIPLLQQEPSGSPHMGQPQKDTPNFTCLKMPNPSAQHGDHHLTPQKGWKHEPANPAASALDPLLMERDSPTAELL